MSEPHTSGSSVTNTTGSTLEVPNEVAHGSSLRPIRNAEALAPPPQRSQGTDQRPKHFGRRAQSSPVLTRRRISTPNGSPQRKDSRSSLGNSFCSGYRGNLLYAQRAAPESSLRSHWGAGAPRSPTSGCIASRASSRLLSHGHGRASPVSPRGTAAHNTPRRAAPAADSQKVSLENSHNDVGSSDDDERVPPIPWRSAVTSLVPLAVPSLVSLALTYGLASIPLAFIGSRLGQEALAGASVGYFIISIVAQYPLCGLTFAMDALCSQEYGRDPESDEPGVILQRGVIIGLAFVVPSAIILLIINMLLPYIYEEAVARHASDFMEFTYLFVVPLIVFTAFSKFCTNQMLPQLPMVALCVGVAVTPVMQMWMAPSGVRGAMLGMAMAAATQLLTIVLLVFTVKRTRMAFGAIRINQALDWQEVKVYLRLAGHSALFVAAEASAFDATVLIAASLGSAEGAAWSATLNMLLMFVAPAGGMGAAACARVGASLGNGLPSTAKRYTLTAIAILAFIVLINCIIIYAFYDSLLSLFGTEGEALVVAHRVKWIIPLVHIGDSMQFVFQGVFSGMGQNDMGAKILIFALWIIGLPLGVFLAYGLHWGLTGVLVGIVTGLMIEWPLMLQYCYKADWNMLAKEIEDDGSEEEEEESGNDDNAAHRNAAIGWNEAQPSRSQEGVRVICEENPTVEVVVVVEGPAERPHRGT